MKTKEEFIIGKHNIGWVDSDLFSRAPEEFSKVEGTPKFQKLTRSMNDAEIENELKPGLCTLGDVLAFLENPSEETKDGYWNLFYLETCVVGVFWSGSDWYVYTWRRDGRTWHRGIRVFSPATGLSALETKPFDALPLELVINGHKYIRSNE